MSRMATPAPLSLVALFDDYVRRVDARLKNGGTDEEAFLKFIKHQEECRIQWNAAEMEVQRLTKEVTKLNHLNFSLEGQVIHGRRLIDQEVKKRKDAENERDTLEKHLGMVRNVLFLGDEGKHLCNETKEKLAFLSNTSRSRMSVDRREHLGTINENGMDSTGSILSDDVSLSLTRSEDELERSALVSGKKWKRHEAQPDDAGVSGPKKRRSLNESVTRGTDRLVATTTVTMHRDGPITARSRINAQDNNVRKRFRKSRERKPSSSESDTDVATPTNACAEPAGWRGAFAAARTPSTVSMGVDRTPQATGVTRTPSVVEACMRTPGTPSLVDLGGGFRPTLRLRAHSFVNKTVIKPELCGPCGKRISFGKIALRCTECRASCHIVCRDSMPLPCVPVCNTPNRVVPANAKLADYAPPTAPMVPAIVQHCINEIESRGLKEVGLYRVPGAESEVRALRDAFLRNKGCPHLGAFEIPVLSGAVKDFLRSFREPIVTHHLWQTFVDAAAAGRDRNDAESSVYHAFSQLPQPNRDTLAFILQHLQRVAECVECKMPASNLARVFGPTLVGYSVPNPGPQEVMSETPLQAAVLELLLSISSDYYNTFARPSTEQINATPRTLARQTSRHGFFGKQTSTKSVLPKNGKFF